MCAMPASAREIYHSRTRGGIRTQWGGTQLWECDSADCEVTEDALMDVTWELHGKTLHVDAIEADPHNRSGKALIRATFGTSSWNAATHPKGTATLSIETASGMEKMLVDALGTTIWSEPGEGGQFVRPVKGDKVLPVDTTVVVVRTAYNYGDVNWNRIIRARRKVNKNEIPRLGAAPGTMLLVGAEIPKYFLVTQGIEVLPVEYRMLYREEGWNKGIEVQKYVRVTAQEKVAVVTQTLRDSGVPDTWLDEDGAASKADGAGRPVTDKGSGTTDWMYKSVVKDVPYGRQDQQGNFINDVVQPFKEDDEVFSHLLGLLQWVVRG